MNQYAAAVLLRNTDGRTHSVAVVNTCPSPEHAITCAEASALKTVAPEEGWSVESSWLFDQHLIDAEFHPAPDRFAGERGAPFDEPRPGTDDWPNAHGRRLNENLEAY